MKNVYQEKMYFNRNNEVFETVGYFVQLIKDNKKYYQELIELFKIENISNEVIRIVGAKELTDILLGYDEKYPKSDRDILVEDVDIISLNRKNIVLSIGKYTQDDNECVEPFKVELLNEPRKDYFNMFNAHKHYDFLIRTNKEDLVLENWNLIKDNYGSNKKFKKKFRVIEDNNKNYVRAITSTGRYQNYDIKFSVFVALLTLHNQMKSKDTTFIFDHCILTDSKINLFIVVVPH